MHSHEVVRREVLLRTTTGPQMVFYTVPHDKKLLPVPISLGRRYFIMKIRKIFFRLLLLLFLPHHLFSTNVEFESSDNWPIRNKIVEEAYHYLDTPYRHAGASLMGVDCSGLAFSVYRSVTGETFSRLVQELFGEGERVQNKLLPGDLVFFDTDEPASGAATHVGIFIGGTGFVHAASAGEKTGVIISQLDSQYYKTRYLGARRLIIESLPEIKIKVDNNSVTKVITQAISPQGMPINISVSILTADDSMQSGRGASPDSGMITGTGFFTISLFREEEFVLSKRIRIGPREIPSRIWFIPEEGKWTVNLEDATGKSLALIYFVAKRSV